MTQTPQKNHARRQHWMSVLARADWADIEHRWKSVGIDLPYTILREPEIGLAQIRGKMANKGDVFNVGDTTITRASVQFKNDVVGHCYTMGRNLDKALTCAVIDGVLQHDQHNQVVMDAVIAPLQQAFIEKRKHRKQEIETSKVDFFTLVRGDG